ncbi:uncharacterized protein LOC141674586 [Apium graveolens]|uniref:uncharacterized protein LOC141674586 n=1 Tax=Apium graveolens TaxID=4045 RepID=UPI003D7A61FB
MAQSFKQISNKLDEVKQYLQGRYVCASEAAWRIFDFDVHYHSSSVERIPIHFPDIKYVYFKSRVPLREVCDKAESRRTKLEAWFIAYQEFPSATNYTYSNFPTPFTSCHVKTIGNTDKGVILLVGSAKYTQQAVSDPLSVWNCHWRSMSDDIILSRRRITHNVNLNLPDADIQNYALAEIEKLFNDIVKSLKDFLSMSFPFDRKKEVYDNIIHSVQKKEVVFFWVIDPKLSLKPFGGITVIFDGDYHQILPVIPKGDEKVEKILDQADPHEVRFQIPSRDILTLTNALVDDINTKIFEKIPEEEHVYLSQDSIDKENDFDTAFPVEYLNSIYMLCISKHELKIKVGVTVMLMRNLNQILGLCNGTE